MGAVAISVLSAGWHAAFYGVATVLFVVAAVVAWAVTPRAVWPMFVALGLALSAFVLFWDSLALA